LHRIRVKYFLANGHDPNLAEMLDVFHLWIQQKQMDGLPLDVADYRHIKEGPGVLIVGHEFDCGLDTSEGRPGFVYVSKQSSSDSLSDRLRAAFHGALTGCRNLETESALTNPLSFRTDEMEIMLLDRLRAPNRDTTDGQVRGQITAVVESLYDPSTVTLDRDTRDERSAFALMVNASDAPPLDHLIRRVTTTVSNPE